MQANLHPKRNKLTLILSDGSKFTTFWSGAETDLSPPVDPTNHVAWTGSRNVNQNVGRLAKFNSKFS